MSLETHDVVWAAGGAPIIDGITISIPRGGFTGLLGPNGCGKSTLLGLARPVCCVLGRGRSCWIGGG